MLIVDKGELQNHWYPAKVTHIENWADVNWTPAVERHLRW